MLYTKNEPKEKYRVHLLFAIAFAILFFGGYLLHTVYTNNQVKEYKDSLKTTVDTTWRQYSKEIKLNDTTQVKQIYKFSANIIN